MKKIVTLFLLYFILLTASAQTGVDTCFTQQQVMDIANNILEMQHQDSLNNELISELKFQNSLYQTTLSKDSILLFRKDQEIELYKVRCKLYEDLAKLNKPKWYETKYVSMLIGAGAMITASWIVYNIK